MVSELKGKRKLMFGLSREEMCPSAVVLYSGLQWVGWCPAALRRTICFTQSTVSNAHPEHQFFPIMSLRAGSFKEGEKGLLTRVWDSKVGKEDGPIQ